jgi:predicted O-linked N-acetylglucosamine transferase (SPINDLY family)
VFCSFNNPAKITPDMFEIWMRLLQCVEKSVLWLFGKNGAVIENLRGRAAMAGIAAERIVFAAFAPMDVYLARLRLADLFLDSFPYNAGATCNDALWAGLPVLTCAGETYVSRMAGSLLTGIGMPELIAGSVADYEATALDLARNRERLAALRGRLMRQRLSFPCLIPFVHAAYRDRLSDGGVISGESRRGLSRSAPRGDRIRHAPVIRCV